MAASSMERQRAGGQPTRRGAIFFLPQGMRVTLRRSLKHAWRRTQDLLWRALDTLSTPGHRYRRTGRAVWSVTGWIVAVGFAALVAFSLFKMTEALIRPWPKEAAGLPLAMVYSTLRMTVAYLVALLWTLPVAVWAGTNRRVMEFVRPVAQIGASIPATALFPLMVVAVIHFAGGMNVASVLLILTGMQWYLLFNLLAGVEAIPAELKEAASSMGLSRWQSFRKLIFPAMLPSLITGSVTGWGGGWNALIVSERITYAGKEYGVTGIGAALDRATYDLGDTTLMVLSLITMVGVIVCMNHFFWRRLYTFASERFRMDL
jgi:NitT/TauT family transport system permease protein